MVRGKHTCKILKDIRRQIAEANDIEFVVSECCYKGDCLGTCPKCESEVRYLEQQLRKRQLMGKAVALVGLSAGVVAAFSPIDLQSQTPVSLLPMDDVAFRADTILVKGTVVGVDTMRNGCVVEEPLMGAVVRSSSSKGVVTDVEGMFAIETCVGDTLDVSYIGYKSQRVVITDDSPIRISLSFDDSVLLGIVIDTSHDRGNMLDLRIVDENDEPLPGCDVTIELVYLDDDGDEFSDELVPLWLDGEGVFRIYWDEETDLTDDEGKPLKEAELRIAVKNYDEPVMLNVKRPNGKASKMIRLKH